LKHNDLMLRSEHRERLEAWAAREPKTFYFVHALSDADALFSPSLIWKKHSRWIIRRSTACGRFMRRETACVEASLMAEPSVAFDTPDIAETIGFLRRFAELMSNGYNAAYLRRACELLETLAADTTAAPNAEALWRYKCESMTRRADALQAKCDALDEKIVRLEARWPQLRSVSGSSNGRNRTIEAQAATEADIDATLMSESPSVSSANGRSSDAAAAEAGALISESTLRQARAQFEFLAREFVPLGNIASQVMCELAANAMDAALHSRQRKNHPAAGEIAQSILDTQSILNI
jgi:hypothetical protein